MKYDLIYNFLVKMESENAVRNGENKTVYWNGLLDFVYWISVKIIIVQLESGI